MRYASAGSRHGVDGRFPGKRRSNNRQPSRGIRHTHAGSLPCVRRGKPIKKIEAGKYRGPLHGVPYAVKDLVSVKGYPTTRGAAPYAHQSYYFNATIIERLNAAGAVLLGKAAMIELAGGLGYSAGTASLTGPARNPWNPECWTCVTRQSGSGRSGCCRTCTVGFRFGHARLDLMSIFVVRRLWIATELRPRQPVWFNGYRLQHGQAWADGQDSRRLCDRSRGDCRARRSGSRLDKRVGTAISP